MATTITWTINTLERATQSGEVQTIHYSVSAVSEDEVYTAGAYGSVGLDPADPEEMVPYSQLTPEQCIEWLHAKLGEEAISNVVSALEQQLEEQRNPSRAQGTPWS